MLDIVQSVLIMLIALTVSSKFKLIKSVNFHHYRKCGINVFNLPVVSILNDIMETISDCDSAQIYHAYTLSLVKHI